MPHQIPILFRSPFLIFFKQAGEVIFIANSYPLGNLCHRKICRRQIAQRRKHPLLVDIIHHGLSHFLLKTGGEMAGTDIADFRKPFE